MGLDTSHDCWDGAYSAFSRWRNAVAEAAGYSIALHENGHETAQIDWGHVTEENLMGEWAETPADPILILIAHSDCDGIIYQRDCGPLADALEALLPKLEGDLGGHIGDIKVKTQKFIDGLRCAFKAGEDVEFY